MGATRCIYPLSSSSVSCNGLYRQGLPKPTTAFLNSLIGRWPLLLSHIRLPSTGLTGTTSTELHISVLNLSGLVGAVSLMIDVKDMSLGYYSP